jgi:hypothetical protein
MRRSDGARRLAGASGSLGAIAVAALIPKCPLCIAAVLSALGVGAELSSSVAPIARPLAIVLAVIAVFLVARAEWRRRAPTCCG